MWTETSADSSLKVVGGDDGGDICECHIYQFPTTRSGTGDGYKANATSFGVM